MPSVRCETNVTITDPKAFVRELSKCVAETLGRNSEEYNAVRLVQDPHLSWGGTFEPAFILSITSVDNLQPENTEKYSKAFFEFMKDKLGVSEDRGYVICNDPGKANIGYKCTTFQQLLEQKE